MRNQYLGQVNCTFSKDDNDLGLKLLLTTEYVLNGDFFLFGSRGKMDCCTESGSKTFSCIYQNGIF